MINKIFNQNNLELLLENLEDELILIRNEQTFKKLFSSYLILRSLYRKTFYNLNSERSEDYNSVNNSRSELT